ncbi:MAG: DUF2254 domain-containing protein [Thermoproteota archaeon]|nr:DUF2254 domain-containing protein [Thermoproteota archaeon]
MTRFATNVLTSRAFVYSSLHSFKQSILFYPIIFATGSVILFLLTSRIDEILKEKVRVDIPYIHSLLFAGSPNAARTILSTIAGGWTTMLGVTFSVALVTLQLSSTKYTSHIVNIFEDDKINQLTLGSFISVVIYSLLVLKTVQTGEGTGITFTPVIGVNTAVFLAIVSLFIFVVFLRNISGYLKSQVLIDRLVDKIMRSIIPYEKRKLYTDTITTLFETKPQQEQQKKQQEQRGLVDRRRKVYDIKSRKRGILRSMNWDRLSKSLLQVSPTGSIHKQNCLMLKYYKSLGDWVEKDSIIATIYSSDSAKNVSKDENSLRNNKKDNHSDQYYNSKKLEQKVLATIDISKNRDSSTDPFYGIEILRSLATKAIHEFNTDIVIYCITGFFQILNHTLIRSKDIAGLPFTLNTANGDGDDNNDDSNNDDKEQNAKLKRMTVIISPKETPISDAVLSELSVIYSMAVSQQQISSLEHFTNEYVSSSKYLLDINKVNEFKRLTRWYSNQISSSSILSSFPKGFQERIIINPLSNFKNQLLADNYPLAVIEFLSAYMNYEPSFLDPG